MKKPKAERILFVGGPKDGKREVFHPYGTQVQVVTPTFRQSLNDLTIDPQSVGITTYTYKIVQRTLPDGTILRVAVDSSVKDLQTQLIKGYRYHRNPRQKRYYPKFRP